MTATAPDHDNFRNLSDVMGDFFGPENTPPKPLVDQLKERAVDINANLAIASRRVLLTGLDEVATRYFEDLAAVADNLRRLIVRAEALGGPPAQRAKAEAALFEEANACLLRMIERIEQDQQDETSATIGRLAELLDLTPQQFEHRTAQMLCLEGFSVEQWGGGAGDISADVIARLPGCGRRVIVQCKHTSDPGNRIGSGVVQKVSGVRQVHKAELAYVMTTGQFTVPARNVARRLGVGLVDGATYSAWSIGYPLSDFVGTR